MSIICAAGPYLKKCLEGEYKFQHQNREVQQFSSIFSSYRSSSISFLFQSRLCLKRAWVCSFSSFRTGPWGQSSAGVFCTRSVRPVAWKSMFHLSVCAHTHTDTHTHTHTYTHTRTHTHPPYIGGTIIPGITVKRERQSVSSLYSIKHGIIETDLAAHKNEVWENETIV